ncbi:MAG: hypothetical protein AAFX06_02710 [Planctomycetota bacterium]
MPGKKSQTTGVNAPDARSRVHRVTTGKLLGLAGCFALIFAVFVQATDGRGWLLFLAIPPIFGSIHGTVRHGFAGFCEGTLFGTLLVPLLLLLLIVVALWLWFLWFFLSACLG